MKNVRTKLTDLTGTMLIQYPFKYQVEVKLELRCRYCLVKNNTAVGVLWSRQQPCWLVRNHEKQAKHSGSHNKHLMGYNVQYSISDLHTMAAVLFMLSTLYLVVHTPNQRNAHDRLARVKCCSNIASTAWLECSLFQGAGVPLQHLDFTCQHCYYIGHFDITKICRLTR